MHIQGITEFLNEFKPSGKDEWESQLEDIIKNFSEFQLFKSLSGNVNYSIFQDSSVCENTGSLNENVKAWNVRIDIDFSDFEAGIRNLEELKSGIDIFGITAKKENSGMLSASHLRQILNSLNPGSEIFLESDPETLKELIRDFPGIQFYSRLLSPGLKDEEENFLKASEILLNPGDPFSKAILAGAKFRPICIEGSLFKQSGSSIVQEMAFSLSWGAEVLSYFTERRFDAAACADLIFFQFDTGSEFYLETAKYRVFRRLWSLILDEYGVNSNPAIHALPSSFETSLYDPYSNLIRMSIQSLASILGGVDAVGNRSFDRMAPLHDIKQLRFSHDILQILRHESGIFNLKDPLMGSYSLSEIEMNLAEESFELFCRLEKQGGYFKCLQNGWIENEIRQNMELKKILLFEQKINITGVNSFINKNESRSVSERNGLSDGFRYQSRGLSFDEGMYGQMNSSEWMSKEMELVRFCADCLKSLSVKGPVVLVFCLKETEKNLLQKIRNTVDSIGCDMIVYNEANEFPSVSSDERSRIAGAVFIQTDFEVLKKVLSELDFRIPVFYDSEIREDVKGNIGRFPSGSYEEMTAFYERVSDFLRQRIDEEKS